MTERTEQHVTQQSSVEITRNAKGQPQVTVKVYGDSPGLAMDEAVAIFQMAERRVGYMSPSTERA